MPPSDRSSSDGGTADPNGYARPPYRPPDAYDRRAHPDSLTGLGSWVSDRAAASHLHGVAGTIPGPYPSGANTPHQSSKPAAARPCRRPNQHVFAAFEPGSFGGHAGLPGGALLTAGHGPTVNVLRRYRTGAATKLAARHAGARPGTSTRFMAQVRPGPFPNFPSVSFSARQVYWEMASRRQPAARVTGGTASRVICPSTSRQIFRGFSSRNSSGNADCGKSW